ncbi:myo-inositol 2-dehydrogenase/D-chiro-inositol 1-dehydrogenase [Nocardia transvalensis]|uniref:Myo-inositol 2-dehydrogenase/D-chiro-inositol 1-dehydrogenase n=1 Tax=Nocardia transvalensis TaxID=37333 RepID=A0A7W9P8Z3_9NOCA|nr:Gfo/Idh/MocA family oxidoreductase [Nocardia transvalensis]MBB5911696.1 myo-inositol 2-dehydrogenase/D-chiro-inositol 1-dehydrogenase [Nocardia transvalensis]
MTLRLGLAGTGRIGTSHAETLKTLPRVGGVVVADADTERARATATKLGVDFAPDIETLLGSGISGLVIATATDSHPELIARAVDRGIPVFCEKPVAADIAGTLAVIDHVESSSVPVQIGFQRRFDAGYTAARAAVASGELGWLHTLRATTLDPTPPPAEYIPRSGGLFRDCGVHDFDIIRWVTGREVTEVFVQGANRGERFFADADDVDTAAVLMRLDDGALATVSLGRYNGAGYDVRLEALGSKGNAIVGLDDRVPLRSVEPDYPASPYPAYPGFMDRFRRAYTEELSAFTKVVAGEAQNPCGPREALEAFYIAEACELSRRQHRPVALTEVRR